MQDLRELREIPPIISQGRTEKQESMDRFKTNGSGRMKLSEMRNIMTGLPEGFDGVKKAWEDVTETFRIEKAAILEKDKKDEDGEVILYKKGPKQGQPVPDRQIAMQLRTASGEAVLVRTNSPRIVSLYTGDLDRDCDEVNRFGDRIYHVEAPEGELKFIPYEMDKKKDGKPIKWDVADLEEVD